MLAITFAVKDLFFDRQAVKDQLDEESRKGLRRLGGFIRLTARGSIKKKGAARKPPKRRDGKAYQKWLAEQDRRPRSPAGSPPFQHTEHEVVNPRNILFAWDGKDAVVVGMVGFRHASGEPVPHEIEFGSRDVQKNPRRTKRKIGDGGEIDIGLTKSAILGPGPQTARLALNTRLGDVMVRYAVLRTQAQVDRANRLQEHLYGPETLRHETAPRPVMAPAFQKGLDKFEPAFAGRLVG